MDKQKWIENKAYELWERDGKRNDVSGYYWYAAEKEWDLISMFENVTIVEFFISEEESLPE